MIILELKIEDNKDKTSTKVSISRKKKTKNQKITDGEEITAGMVYNTVSEALEKLSK